jgi:hypothetical protein
MNNMPADNNRRVLVVDGNRAIHDDSHLKIKAHKTRGECS